MPLDNPFLGDSMEICEKPERFGARAMFTKDCRGLQKIQ